MKAITYTGHGGYDVIAIADLPVREPAAGEVRITVKAAAINPTDLLLRSASYGPGTALPIVPGMDAAGVIESVGAGVERLKVGDQVMAATTPRRPEGGAQIAQLVVPAASVVTMPKGASFAQASTLPMNGLTALFGLELAGLSKGQTLAVSGGAGLLAYYVIVLAKRQGLTVIADAKASETDLVRGYGADIVVARGDGFCDELRQHVPAGVDALFDTALLLEKAFPAIRDGGVIIPVRGWGETPTVRGIQIKPVFVSKVLERTDWLTELRDLASSGDIKLRVTGEYAPERVADGQKALEAGGLRGRPVVVF